MTSKRPSLVIACGVLAAALAGCQNGDEITRYQVPREPRSRLLAAILPHGERTWFVKVQGSETAVGEHEGRFREFIRSLRFDDKADPPLTWEKAPDGWTKTKEQPKQGDIKRFATFRLAKDAAQQPLELTVLSLGKEGKAASVLANVNRWRGQLGLPAVGEEDLGDITSKLQVGGVSATLVDMVGTAVRFAGRRPAFPENGGERPRPAPGGGPDKAGPLTYKVPDGWQPAKARAFSVATFRTGAGDQAAEVTITPAGGGLVSNVQRWREQLGLPQADDAAVRKELRDVEVGGAKGHLVHLVGPNRDGRRTAILGAIVPHAGSDWFFKMTGPAEVVTGQRAAFDAFLRSVRFDEKKGQP